MRYAFYTLSGARYMIDTDLMLWKRDGEKSNQAVVAGVGKTEGLLFSKPDVRIGLRGALQVGPRVGDYIYFTQVQRIELLEVTDWDGVAAENFEFLNAA